GRSASLQRTFKKSFTSFSHSTRNKTRDGLIRVRNIRALNGRFNTSITHAYSIVIGSKHITLNAKIPKHLFQGYLNIYNNYFKAPWMPDRTEANPNELNQDDARYGFRC